MNNPENKGSNWPKIADLQKLDLKALRVEYEKFFGKPSQSRNRKQLFGQIAKRLQEGESSAGMSQPTKYKESRTKDSAKSSKSVLTAKFEPKRKRLERRAPRKQAAPRARKSRPAGTIDLRLPKAGTTITKKYKGRTIHVRVLEKGFSYEGKPYGSLSAVAKKVTGAIWNGFLFFGLTERPSK